MNKIYLTLLLMVTFVWASAQSSTQINANGMNQIPVNSAQQMAAKQSLKSIKSNTKTDQSRWYNYATTMNTALGNASSLALTYLFPDTNIVANFGSTYGSPWIHAAGVVLDPKSAWFQSSTELNIGAADNYAIDSVGIFCSYTRNDADPNIVDTLIVAFLAGNHTDLPTYYFTGMSASYLSDTVRFRAMLCNPDGSLKAASKIVVKYPLTAATAVDTTAQGWNYIVVGAPSPINVAAGEVVAVSYRFKPGYSYSHSDTLNSHNYFTMTSYEEQGINTYPTYSPGDYNSSQIETDASIFNPSSSWYGFFIPEWAYAQAYSFENHIVDFKLTVHVGIDASENNLLSVSQNRPNPFSGTTAIDYNLNKAANVNVAIYNVAGAQVMNLSQGLQSAGNHSIQINAAELPAGIYYYTFTADNNTITKKMIVY